MAAPQPDINTIRDLVYPAVIAIIAALASFSGSFYISKKDSSNEKQSKRTNILDNLIADFTLLSEIVDKLKIEGEEKVFFSLKTIQAGQGAIAHLRRLIESIVVFSDTRLRRNIIEVVEDSYALFSDLSGLETYVLNRNNDLEAFMKQYRQEMRSLRTKLLKMDIIMDANYPMNLSSPILEDPSVGDERKKKLIKRLDAARVAISDLEIEKNSENSDYQNALKFDEKRRFLYNIRLLDISTKLRELLHTLTSDRKRILNR